jgi:hypothetical protein
MLRFVIRRSLQLRPHAEEAETAPPMLAQQEERYAEAQARAITLGVGWLSVAALGLPAVILLGVIVAVGLGLMGFEVSEGTFFFVSAVVGLPALLAGWTYVVSRKSAEIFPSHRLVLWLRRFHRPDLMEFPFPSFLERVCRGIAVPITLQDSTVSSARTAAELRLAFHVERGVVAASWFALVFSGLGLWQRPLWFRPQTLLLAAVAAVALAGLVAGPIAIRRLGALNLGSRRGQRLVKRLLDAIDSNEGVPQTLTIVSTPDDSWQSWVLEFMTRADAVLIDVTHLSANLHWELRAIAAHLDAAQLILAYGESEREAGMSTEIRAELARLLGGEMLERSHRFLYTFPQHRGWPSLAWLRRSRGGWLKPSPASAQVYSRQLARALEKAFVASDQRASPEAAES